MKLFAYYQTTTGRVLGRGTAVSLEEFQRELPAGVSAIEVTMERFNEPMYINLSGAPTVLQATETELQVSGTTLTGFPSAATIYHGDTEIGSVVAFTSLTELVLDEPRSHWIRVVPDDPSYTIWEGLVG